MLRRWFPGLHDGGPGTPGGGTSEPSGIMLDGYAYVRYVCTGFLGEGLVFPPLASGFWWVARTTLPEGLTVSDQNEPVVVGYPTTAETFAYTIPIQLSGYSDNYELTGNIVINAEPSFTVWNPEDREIASRGVRLLAGPAPYLQIEGIGSPGLIGGPIRALNGYTTGKHYWEVKLVSTPGTAFALSLGVDGSRFGNGESGDFMSQPIDAYNDAGVWGYTLFSNDGSTQTATIAGLGVSTATTALELADNDWLRLAFDADAGSLWIGRSSTWIGGGDPAAGTSPTITGISLEAGSFWSDFKPLAFVTNGVVLLANFGSQTWDGGGPPTGFSGCAYTRITRDSVQVWDTGTQSLDADMGGAPGLYMTIDTANSVDGHRLSGTRAYFNRANSPERPHSVLGSNPRSTGRYQFEIEMLTPWATLTHAGLCPFDWDNTTTMNRPGYTSDSFGFTFAGGNPPEGTADGEIHLGGSLVDAFPQSTTGDIATFDCNLTAGTVDLYRNGVLIDTFTLPSTGKAWVPCFAGGAHCAGRLITTDLTYPVVGATNWNVMEV